MSILDFDFINENLYEVEQENKNGGGTCLYYSENKEEMIHAAWIEFKNMTAREKELYNINVNCYVWNHEEEHYEYNSGFTFDESEQKKYEEKQFS